MDKSENRDIMETLSSNPAFREKILEEAKDLIQTLSEIIKEEDQKGKDEPRDMDTMRDLLAYYKGISEDILRSTKACIEAIEKFEDSNPEDYVEANETKNLIESFQQVNHVLDGADDMYRRLAFSLRLVLANTIMGNMTGNKRTYGELLDKDIL